METRVKRDKQCTSNIIESVFFKSCNFGIPTFQIHEYSSSIPISPDQKESVEKMEESVGVQRHEQLLESINAVILAQQSALEILTNITCDDEAPWEEVASESGESDMIDDIEVESNDAKPAQLEALPLLQDELLLGLP